MEAHYTDRGISMAALKVVNRPLPQTTPYTP
jgi:hypothetical protein